MKTVTMSVYTISELAGGAKQSALLHVRDSYMGLDEIFHEDMKEMIHQDFPQSDFSPEWSLSSCQGDGVNFHGRVVVGGCSGLYQGTQGRQSY